ncbi:MAG: hypothetical protein ABSE41_18240 [Bacteroidota bacterium]|jgi:hypothetical protein
MNSGCLVTLAVLLPNLAFLFFPPTKIPETTAGSRTFSGTPIQIMERIGQAGVFIIPFFYKIELQGKIGLFAVAPITLTIYYAGWWRYVRHGRAYKLLFSPLFGIPLPMAISPVVYFGAWSFLFNSWPLATATLILAIGHISVSNKERKRSS